MWKVAIVDATLLEQEFLGFVFVVSVDSAVVELTVVDQFQDLCGDGLQAPVMWMGIESLLVLVVGTRRRGCSWMLSLLLLLLYLRFVVVAAFTFGLIP
jgi:hypothetical protein